jgi:hypothetical protein
MLLEFIYRSWPALAGTDVRKGDSARLRDMAGGLRKALRANGLQQQHRSATCRLPRGHRHWGSFQQSCCEFVAYQVRAKHWTCLRERVPSLCETIEQRG